METETALTAFCMATVLIIVGLVALTATQLNLADSPLVGNYIGVPEHAHYEGEPVIFAEVDPKDLQCYDKGVSQCQQKNHGNNFVLCADRVALDCGLPTARFARCFLPAGFELKYLSRRECNYGVIDDCKVRCPPGLQQDCVQSSKSRCDLIGGAFQAQHQEERYTVYG